MQETRLEYDQRGAPARGQPNSMARLIMDHDWSATPLGPPAHWPPQLSAAIDIMLHCGFPATLQWGPELILLYNDAYTAIIGKHHPHALGKPILQSFPEIADTYQPIVDRLQRGEVVVLENQLYRYAHSGTHADHWFDLSHSPVRGSNGAVAGILVIGVETTGRILAERERSRATQALLQSEQRLRRVLETETVGVIFFNPSGTVIDANDVFLRMTGYTRDDIASGHLNWRVMTPEEFVPISEAQMERFRETGRIGPYEKQYILKDGSRRWLLFAGRDLGDGTIAEYCLDVSDRHRAEAALHQTESYFQALVSATSDIIYRISPDWKELCSLRGNGLLADTTSPNCNWLETYIPVEERPLVLDAIQQAIRHKTTFELEHRILQPDGSIGWVFSRAIPLLDGAGNITEWFGAATNITPRKRAELGLRENEKLAVVGRLASSIAHEINNPLEAVTNLLFLAESDASPEVLSLLQQAQSELDRVGHIVTETLRFNRRTASATPTRTSEIVDSVLTLHGGRIRAAGITVQRRYTEHKPVMLFANELRQVVANLIGNAIDAMTASTERRLLVRVRQAHEPRTGAPGVRLTVADTGTGITPATRRRIYEAFFTTKEATGTGLGLWVTHEIVRKHGGSMHVRSRTSTPCGTVFAVFIPSQPDPLQP